MTKRNTEVRFTDAEKHKLEVGAEMTDGEIIWRKLADGSGTWRYDFRMHNKRYKGSLGREKNGVTLSQARQHVSRIRAQATLEDPSPSAAYGLSQRPFRLVAQDFLTWSQVHHRDFAHNDSRMRNHLLPHFAEEPIGSISVASVESLRTNLLKQQLKLETVRRIISLLSNVFEYAKQTDRSLPNPTRQLRSLRQQKSEIEVFSDTEVDQILDPANNPEVTGRAMVALARFAGLRASEVLGLQWDSVDLENSQIHVHQTVVNGQLAPTTKSGVTRRVPISSRLRPILQELQQTDPTSIWLFPGRAGTKPLFQVQPTFRRMKKRANLQGAPGFHGLRHRFATSALENGVTIHVVKDWMGHQSITMTQQYIHMTSTHTQEMAHLLL